MTKIDHSKFADKALAIVIGRKKGDDAKDNESEPDESDDSEENEPGKLGRMLASALRHNDYEAVEEVIRQIAEDCAQK